MVVVYLRWFSFIGVNLTLRHLREVIHELVSVRAVDVAAVTQAAARWASPADLFAVVVGDRARVEEELRGVMPRVVVTQG